MRQTTLLRSLSFLALPFLLCANSEAPAATLVYSTDFGSGLDPQWSGGNIATSSILGAYSGSYTLSQSTNLTLTGLAPHNSVKLEFDLYLFNSWDGENLTFGKDFFSLSGDVNGSWTFTNHQPEGQSYPGTPDEIYGSGASATHVYRNLDSTGTGNGFSVTHNSDTFSVTFGGPTTQTDELWGIDNVRVSINAVPVPAAAWLFGSGLFALFGFGRSSNKEAK